MAGRWFSPGTPEKKTDRNDITEIFVESCTKHHNPNPIPTAYLYLLHFTNGLVIHDQIFKWKIVSTRFVFHNNIGWLQ